MKKTTHATTLKVAALLCAASLTFGGCGQGINDSATLVNINKGEDKITLGYGNFVARMTQAQYDNYYIQIYGEGDYWSSPADENGDENSQTVQESVKSNVLDDLQDEYVSRQHAKDFDVELTDEQNKNISDTVDKFFEENSEETIKTMGATREYLTRYLEDQYYDQLVEEAAEAEAAKTIKYEDVIQAAFSYVHVYNDKYAEDYVERPDEELKASAEAVASASDFDAAAKEQGLEVEDDVYTRDMSPSEAAEEFRMPEEIYKALKKIDKEGGVSGVIPVEDSGYYVVRLDKFEDEDETNAELDNQLSIYYQDHLKEWLGDLDWEVDDKQWAKVQFDTLFITEEQAKADEAAEEGTEEASEDSQEEAAE